MSGQRLADYVAHMAEAAGLACSYVKGLSEPGFFADKRTQQAVIFNLLIIGEAATKVLLEHAAFAELHPQVPWRSMKGMRNRLAHGYFDIDLAVVWQTVQTALPSLLEQLAALELDGGQAPS
ncbi:DUF86 domain-containing protein [Azohydromonas lata]|uniref:DUF86 domain-containing protein n=2 Tax=Azohydromonas lata TaxID=45677 RepID=A0ABU5IKN3_9BURK|nr:DUF86 domain-containing protein [Azohydromonas lata]MDZ5459455.1 DUF86 domain-containing protein [Azohydromonas lata]